MASLGDRSTARLEAGHRQQTLRQRRQRARRVGIVAALVLALALAIPALGYYIVFLQPLRGTALRVNERVYTWGEYLLRTRMVIAQAQATGVWQPDTLNELVFDMIDELERGEIILQYAPQEGLTVSPQELQRELRVRILGAGRADDPTVTEAEFQERYRRRLDLLKISAEKFEEVARVSFLRRKFEERVKGRLPTEVLHRHFLVIQTSSELEEARKALARVESGEDFSTVAQEVSKDSKVKENGGDWGWIPKGVREEFDELLFTLADGETRGPIIGRSGAFVIQAVGEPEVRPLSDDHRTTLETRAMDTWLTERRNELAKVQALERPAGGITTARYNWILQQLREDRELFPRRQSG